MSHNFGGCVGHPGDFSPASGQALYRHAINERLARSDLGVRLADTGEDIGRIVVADDDALVQMVDEVLARPPAGHTDDVAHAVALFRHRRRDVAAMRSAIIALAGVLESHRALLKQDLLSKDEGVLFQLANTFDLRHRRGDQRTDFDPAFLQWVFHWYLATVGLVATLVHRQQEEQEPTAESDQLDSHEPF